MLTLWTPAPPMDAPDLLLDLDELTERLKDREQQTDPDTLAFSAGIMNDVITFLGTTKKGLGELLGVPDEKSVREWTLGRATPRRGALLTARLLIERHVEAISQPGDTGPTSAEEALAPHLTRLAEAARRAGWSADDVAATFRKWATGAGATSGKV